MSVFVLFACDNAPRAVFLSLFDKPKMLGIMAVADKKDSYALFLVSGIACVNAPRAVFYPLFLRPMMLCIMAGMLQYDSCLRRTGKLDYLGDGAYFSSAFWKNFTFSYVKGGLSDPVSILVLMTANCGVSAVAVLSRSSTSLSWRIGRFPWSRQFVRP